MPMKSGDHLSSIIGRHTANVSIPSSSAAAASALVGGWVAPFNCSVVFIGSVGVSQVGLPAPNANNYRKIDVFLNNGDDDVVAICSLDSASIRDEDFARPIEMEIGDFLRIQNTKVGNGFATPASVVAIQYVPSKRA